MPQSRKRGGKKAHNKRVQARNQRLGQERNRMNKLYTEMMEQKLREFQDKFSGLTENTEESDVTNIETVAEVVESNEQPTEEQTSELEK